MLAMHTSISQIRRELLLHRASFSKAMAFDREQTCLMDNLQRFLGPAGSQFQSIAFCWPYQDEIDLRDLLLRWQRGGVNRHLLLPKILPDKRMDFYTWIESDSLINNAFGIPEPDPSKDGVRLLTPDCILIPCVGWGFYAGQYWRLGYGGGYFDRTILSIKNAGHSFQSVGIAFDWQEVGGEQWLPENHDQPLDHVLTNTGIFP